MNSKKLKARYRKKKDRGENQGKTTEMTTEPSKGPQGEVESQAWPSHKRKEIYSMSTYHRVLDNFFTCLKRDLGIAEQASVEEEKSRDPACVEEEKNHYTGSRSKRQGEFTHQTTPTSPAAQENRENGAARNKSKRDVDQEVGQFIRENLYFRRLCQDDMTEIENLHKEWFPLDYPKNFYEGVLKKDRIIAIGCFIENPYGSHSITNKNEEGKELCSEGSLSDEDDKIESEELQKPQEIMLGSIISKVKIGKEDVIDIHLHAQDEEFKRSTSALYYWSHQMLGDLLCKNLCFNPRTKLREAQGCYIMTVGIIDECRKMGLGSLLLEQTYTMVRDLYPECKMAYLHCVDYNTAAIRFYREKNGYVYLRTEYDHYVIFSKDYDALVLYKMIN